MPDREKVISNLQGVYEYLRHFENTAKMGEWVADALAMLKEQKATQKDGYNLQELWKRARAGETLNETELNFLLADWDERNIFKQQELGDCQHE